MDDVVCISPSQNRCPDAPSLPQSPTASVNSKIGKSKLTKEGQSTSSALNKLSSQIRKPPRRKTSPVNWFPRKKVDSYLNRKIKMLQEVDGMNLTLDQTLGTSNPHYSRVLREKMAVRKAAQKAMEARRAALVEASWCRILRAAGIPSDDAESQLLKAEKSANEAIQTAKAMGVIMFDLPDCPRKYCQVETPSLTGEGSSTHTFTASFETAFEVDKEVAAAVKTAFIRLANCSSFSEDEFKELLKKISENPDADESHQDLYEFSSECESESGSELDSVSQKSDFNSEDLNSKKLLLGVSPRKSKRRQALENKVKLVDMMIERLKCLEEGELSSLATIVATYGLNAALAEVQNIEQHNPGCATEHTSSSAIDFTARRMSSLGLGKAALDGKMRKKQVEPELPSLDKFLVKHMTKLEREVMEAKKNRKNETELGKDDSSRKSVDETPSEIIPDLGSILVKNYSKLEKDIKDSKIELGKEVIRAPSGKPRGQKDHMEVPGLDKVLVKHVSRLEKEVQEAKKRTIKENRSLNSGRRNSTFYSDEATDSKENINLNTEVNLSSEVEENKDGLEKILIKPVHRLEREKLHALSQGSRVENYRQRKNHGATNIPDCESLDKVLVKHVSRLEKEKLRINSVEEWGDVKRTHKNNIPLESNDEGGGLDQVLVKHKSRLEREKMAAATQQTENPVSISMTRREARERELQESWGGISLGASIKPRISKLERDKAAWIKAEEEERRQARAAI